MQIEFDKYNSEVFGIKMGNVRNINPHSTNKDIVQMINQAKCEQYRHLNIKIDPNHKMLINLLLANNFKLVDTQLMFRIDTNKYCKNIINTGSFGFREHRNDDLPQLIRIAKSSYTLDQYHSDSSLDNALCDLYYAKWIENSCLGFADKVMVIDQNDSINGYITLKYDVDKAIAGLAAVRKEFRGKGIFTFMISSTLDMLYNENIKTMLYGTQITNVAVLKTIGHFGGTIEYSNHILHLMI